MDEIPTWLIPLLAFLALFGGIALFRSIFR